MRRSVYGSTRKDAADKLAKAIANDEEPRTTPTTPKITVREFFAQYDEAVRDTMRRRSLETYRDIARLHLLPELGNKKLKDLTREQVQRMYSQKRDVGLSAARVRRIHGVLSSALNHALRGD
jgi:integrase